MVTLTDFIKAFAFIYRLTNKLCTHSLEKKIIIDWITGIKV